MLIGIDMLGIQSAESGLRESGRYGHQLVENLLAADSSHRFILYTHEGLPTDRIPVSPNAARISLAPISGGSTRLLPTIQRVIDQNPDGLDWLLLLDPFEPNYGGVPPESPLNGLKLASLIMDLAPNLADDRRLAPLRHHEAILAVSDATANACRRRLGSASWRVSKVDVACDASFAGESRFEPLTRVSGEELGRLGINGPFLFAHVVGGNERANLAGIVGAYHRLSFEQRNRHQLVVAGRVENPWSIVANLHDRGCADGLVLVGEVEVDTLRMLYRRCSAFLSPAIEEGSGLTLVEAMVCGAPVIAARTGAQPTLVGDAGLLVDPLDHQAISEQLSHLLSDADLEQEIRRRAIARGQSLGWEAVIRAVLASFEAEQVDTGGRRHRIDRAHAWRPRVAIFAEIDHSVPGHLGLEEQVPTAWSDGFHVDLYVDPADASLIDGLPPGLGGFDSRQFERNDRILGYHAVIYRLSNFDELESRLARLRSRPGLVLFRHDSWHEFLGTEDPSKAIVLTRLRELFLTRSRLAAPTVDALEQIQGWLPEFAGQVLWLPIGGPSDLAASGIALRDILNRCSAEMPRGPARRLRRPGTTPHSVRISSDNDETASRSR